jgi:hypothetical protein
MGNIQKYGGPLSAHWLQQQETLGQQIVERATDLGMLPAVPAFAGHVPVALKTYACFCSSSHCPASTRTRTSPKWAVGMVSPKNTRV